MFRLASFTALMLVATPALASEVVAQGLSAVTVHRGQVLRDVNGVRLGAIDSVAADGSIGLVVDGRYVRLPASTVTNVDGKAQTSLAKKDTKSMR